jgi:predicted ester cyclase
MATEENKALVRRFFQAFAANDKATLHAILAPDLAAHLPGDAHPVGREGFLEIVQAWNTAFGSLQFTIEEQIAEGDAVATRVLLQGVHDGGAFLDLPPRGGSITVRVLATERIRKGRIVERWVVLDLLDLVQQLGADSDPS